MKIIKPSDPELLGKLERKLQEYETRPRSTAQVQPVAQDAPSGYFAGESLAASEVAEEIFRQAPPHTIRDYKIFVLRTVLEQGIVDVSTLMQTYEKDHGEVLSRLFAHAASVIDHYCQGVPDENESGTGLR